jgi:hypothetical protein
MLAILIVMAICFFFARDRLRLALKVGIALYALLYIARIAFYGRGDAESLTDLIILLAVFGALWAIGWLTVNAILARRRQQQAGVADESRRRE